MKISDEVKIIEYSKKVDTGNWLTHALGALLGAVGLAALLAKAVPTHSVRIVAAAAVYGVSIIAVYAVSAVYHALPAGEHKRRARLLDHSTVPLLIAGTATPCAMITLFNLNRFNCVLVMCLAWFCFFFGLFAKLFFFEKLKTVCIVVYIVCGTVMMVSTVPLLGQINGEGFGLLAAGCAVYLLGGLFCNLGIKKPALHIVFHLLVMCASGLHFAVIYSFVF